MQKLKIISSFTRLSDASFESTAQHILASITGNGNFPTPNPTIAVLQDAVTRYTNALLAAKDPGKNNIAEKNESRQALELLLTQLAMYIMNICNGSLTMLTGSGFPISKEREPRYIESPGNVILSNGISSGELVAQVKPGKADKGYVHQIATELPTENTVWDSNVTTSSKFTFKELQPGKQYWVRVAVTGARQQVAYSTMATQFAQ